MEINKKTLQDYAIKLFEFLHTREPPVQGQNSM